MLTRQIRKKFSGGDVFGLLDRFKQAARVPLNHFRRIYEPSGHNYSNMLNTTEEGFDEVTQEWQALLINNPYDVQIYNQLEQTAHGNFGTVDNPHLIFTSDAPFRYVGCTGPTNEDDYEGHEFQIFMLRDGPLQRCCSCGQVFKLVRLRDTYSPEQDYYQSNFLPYDYLDMIESDTTVNTNIFKMTTHHEYSQFETQSNQVYSLVNPDDHDRILTDPAYRMEKTKIMENKVDLYIKTLNEIEKDYIQYHGGMNRYPMNKIDYMTLIDVEKAIYKMDRLFDRVQKFNTRKYTDSLNHQRRENRMLERSKNRWESNYTFFMNELSEEEQKYRDYYETDIEKNPENEQIQDKLDEFKLLQSPEYKLDRYDFQESYTNTPEEDQTSYVEKLMFKFKYRMAQDSIQDYAEKNNKMIQASIQRYQDQKIEQILNSLSLAVQQNDKQKIQEYQNKWVEFQIDEAVNQYKEYFGENNQELEILEKAKLYNREQLLNMFDNLFQLKPDQKGFATLPKYQRNNQLGFWANFVSEMKYINSTILPAAKQVSQAATAQIILPTDIESAKMFHSFQNQQTLKLEKK